MIADHLLHIDIDHYGATFRITCEHATPDPRWHTVNEDGEQIDDYCWVPEWQSELMFEDYAHGEWPNDPSFPLPVRCTWDGDGLIVDYEAPAS